MNFPTNQWYMAAWASEIGDAPLGRTICNEPIVLFRDRSSGQVSALLDRCCHRGAPLSMGEVTDKGLCCGYHGVVFNGCEVVQDLEAAFDHVADNVTGVANADVLTDGAGDHAVGTDEAEVPGQELVTAATVVAVEQDDLRHTVLAGDLGDVAHADHVLRGLAVAGIAAAGLANFVRLEALSAQPVDYLDGRDQRVAVTGLVVSVVAHNAGSVAGDQFIGERSVRTVGELIATRKETLHVKCPRS